jgi:hypothetical protein
MIGPSLGLGWVVTSEESVDFEVFEKARVDDGRADTTAADYPEVGLVPAPERVDTLAKAGLSFLFLALVLPFFVCRPCW